MQRKSPNECEELKKRYTFALCGNPNCGKTTIFNNLTKTRQKVGNWPGVTVEKATGKVELDNKTIEIVDLPGVYSLSAFSVDEKIARDFLVSGDYDFVVNVVDGANFERSLYLTIQMIEMKIPMIVIFNKMDIVRKKRQKIELEHLQHHLGCAVVPLVATKKEGFDALFEQIRQSFDGLKASDVRIEYETIVEQEIARLLPLFSDYFQKSKIDTRWGIVKLLEDSQMRLEDDFFSTQLQASIDRIEKHNGEFADIVIADGRYGFINGLTKEVRKTSGDFRRTFSDKVDKVVLNRILGIPIFFAVVYAILFISIRLSDPFIGFFEQLFEAVLVDGASLILEQLSTPSFLTSLVVDGFARGIVIVSTFVPPIFLMFLCLSILEESGYISRAAFIADKFMKRVSLPGKSFIPMIIGFGCTVPALLATRTLDNKRDRFLTCLMSPFISCGARLPIYVLFGTVFFPQNSGLIIFSLYLIGVLLAFFTGFVMKKTILQGEGGDLVMELPPYHIPTLRGILFHTWDRLKGFLVRAGRLIILIVVVLNIASQLGSFNENRTSVLERLGRAVTPIFSPMGIEKDNWVATVSLFTGLLAKEAVVGTMNALYSENSDKTQISKANFGFIKIKIGVAFNTLARSFPVFNKNPKEQEENALAGVQVRESVISKMRSSFKTKTAAYAYLLFVLIYTPCIAAVAAVYNETNLTWTLFTTIYLTSFAWVVAVLFYKVSTLFLTPLNSTIWILSLLIFLTLLYTYVKYSGLSLKVVEDE